MTFFYGKLKKGVKQSEKTPSAYERTQIRASAVASTNQRARNGHHMPSLAKITMPYAGDDDDAVRSDHHHVPKRKER